MVSQNMDYLKTLILNNDINEIKNMINSGLDVNFEDHEGVTPLQIAAAYGSNSIIKLLMVNNAEIDKPNDIGWTPLMHAARNGHSSTVKTLLKHGADINLKNGMGASVQSLAAASGSYLTVKHLMTALPLEEDCPITPLSTSILCGHDHLLTFLLNFYHAGAPLPETGMTALMMAALKGENAVIQQMMQNGAEINKQNILGQTAIDIAQMKYNIQLIKIIEDTEKMHEWKACTANRQNTFKICERISEDPVELLALNHSEQSLLTSPVTKKNTQQISFPLCAETSDLYNIDRFGLYQDSNNNYPNNTNTIHSSIDVSIPRSILSQIQTVQSPHYEFQKLHIVQQNSGKECDNYACSSRLYNTSDKQMSVYDNAREACLPITTPPPLSCNTGDLYFSVWETLNKNQTVKDFSRQSNYMHTISNSLFSRNETASHNTHPERNCPSEHFLQHTTLPTNQNGFRERNVECTLPENNFSFKISETDNLKTSPLKETIPLLKLKNNKIQGTGPFCREIDMPARDQYKNLYLKSSANCSTLKQHNNTNSSSHITSVHTEDIIPSDNLNLQQMNISKATGPEIFSSIQSPKSKQFSPIQQSSFLTSTKLFSSNATKYGLKEQASAKMQMPQHSQEEHSLKKQWTGQNFDIKDTSVKVPSNKKCIPTIRFSHNPAEPSKQGNHSISPTIHITQCNDSSNDDHVIPSPTISISCDSMEPLISKCKAVSPTICISYDTNTSCMISPESNSSTQTICISHDPHEPQNLEIKLPSPIHSLPLDIRVLYSPERYLSCLPAKIYPNTNKLFGSHTGLSNQTLTKKKRAELQVSFSSQTRLFSINSVQSPDKFTIKNSYNKIKRSNSI